MRVVHIWNNWPKHVIINCLNDWCLRLYISIYYAHHQLITNSSKREQKTPAKLKRSGCHEQTFIATYYTDERWHCRVTDTWRHNHCISRGYQWNIWQEKLGFICLKYWLSHVFRIVAAHVSFPNFPTISRISGTPTISFSFTKTISSRLQERVAEPWLCSW